MVMELRIGLRSEDGTWPAERRAWDDDGVPEVLRVEPVSSHAEAVRRAARYDCGRLDVPREVMQEMVEAGVGPSVA